MPIVSARNKLLVSVTLIVIIGFSITNGLNYFMAKRALRESIIHSSLPLTRDNIYSEIQRDIMRPIFVSSLMANDTFLIDWALNGEKNVDQVARYLSEIKNKYGFFASFFISERTRNYYYYDGILKKISPDDEHDDWYFNFKDLGVDYDLDIDTNQAEGDEMTVFINHRLDDYDYDLLGVTGVGLQLSRIVNLLSVYQVKYDRMVYLVDQNGLMQAHPDNTLVNTTNIRLMDGIKDVADEILKIRQSSADFEYEKGGDHILLTSRYIPELGWYLIVEQNQTDAMGEIRQTTVVNMAWAIVITILVLIINVLTVNHFQQRLERVAMTDELSGSYNRRQYESMFRKARSSFIRTGQPASIILFDIDGFKKLNDTFGHTAGDRVIRQVATISRETVREHDSVIRWGGDEFMIMSIGTADEAAAAARRIADRIASDEALQAIIRTRPFAGRITISCGVAQLMENDTDETVVIRADQALYRAKAGGRDRIEIAPNG